MLTTRWRRIALIIGERVRSIGSVAARGRRTRRSQEPSGLRTTRHDYIGYGLVKEPLQRLARCVYGSVTSPSSNGGRGTMTITL
jgi:hypothetical protein